MMAQHHNNQGGFDEDFLDYIQEELTEQPDNSYNLRSMFVAATEACMQFSAVLPVGRSAITSRSQPIPCSDINSNSNLSINIACIENMGLVDGSSSEEGAM